MTIIISGNTMVLYLVAGNGFRSTLMTSSAKAGRLIEERPGWHDSIKKYNVKNPPVLDTYP